MFASLQGQLQESQSGVPGIGFAQAQDGFDNIKFLDEELDSIRLETTGNFDHAFFTSIDIGFSYTEHSKSKLNQGFFLTKAGANADPSFSCNPNCLADAFCRQVFGHRLWQGLRQGGDDRYRPPRRRLRARHGGDHRRPGGRVAAVRAGQVEDHTAQGDIRLHGRGEDTRQCVLIAPDVGVVIQRVCQSDSWP